MKSLAEIIFNITPNWFRVLFFELDEDEERFMEVAIENRIKISEYLGDFRKERVKTYEEMRQKFTECEEDSKTMKFLISKCKSKRFHKYFSECVDLFEYNMRFLLGYH
jgi:hypothetical protein